MILNQVEASLLPMRINIKNTDYTQKKIIQDTKKHVKKTRRSTSYHLPSLASEDFCDDGGDSSVSRQLFFSGTPQRNGFPS